MAINRNIVRQIISVHRLRGRIVRVALYQNLTVRVFQSVLELHCCAVWSVSLRYLPMSRGLYVQGPAIT